MKTNAMRILDTLGIRYEVRHYEVDQDDLSTNESPAISACRRTGLQNPGRPRRSPWRAAGGGSGQCRSRLQGICAAKRRSHGRAGSTEGGAAADRLSSRRRHRLGVQGLSRLVDEQIQRSDLIAGVGRRRGTQCSWRQTIICVQRGQSSRRSAGRPPHRNLCGALGDSPRCSNAAVLRSK